LDESADHGPTVPALHVILTRPATKASLAKVAGDAAAREALRRELVAYLADELGGDSDAAEWVLLALVARMYAAFILAHQRTSLTPIFALSHTRHATGMALGSLSLNLALPDAFSTSLPATIASLVPTASSLDLSIASLNDSKTRLAPRSRDENLESGRLQLANGTAVVVDLRGIGEGKLEDTGALLPESRFPRPRRRLTHPERNETGQACETCGTSRRRSRSKSSRTNSPSRRSSSRRTSTLSC